MQSFKVSIIIPVFNREKFIKRAVESCVNLTQTGEIIIIDDGSTDNTLSIIKNLETRYNNIKILCHPDKKNHGCSASRNLGIKNAKFEYISFLDSDDWYLPNRFNYEEIIFKNNYDIDGVYGITTSIFENEKAKETFYTKFSDEISKIDNGVQPKDLYKCFLFGNQGLFHTNAIVIKKSSFQKSGTFPVGIQFCEDVNLWCRLAAKCKLVSNQNSTPIAVRYIHFSNIILNTNKIFDSSFYYLYESLFIWAFKQNDFSYDKKNDFFIGYKKMYPNESDLKTLGRFLWRNPRFLFYRYTLRKFAQIIKGK